MRIVFILLFCLTAFVANAQFSDDFSDGDFTNNPTWSGNTDKYIISTSSSIPADMRPGLQSSNTVADTTFLSVENNMLFADSIEWTFWAKLSFNPSANNFGRVYLSSDAANLKGSLNGYYVSLSYNGVDRLHFVKQEGTNHTVLITGSLANLNKTTNTLRIKVIRDNAGNWTMMSDTLGGKNFSEEGTVQDVSFTESKFFGIFTQYTSSNAGKFYFDDFYAGPIIKDTTPPSVTKVDILGPTMIDVYFSEDLKPSTATNNFNYKITPTIGNPIVATLDGTNPALVHLILQYPIENGVMYELKISGIEDKSGNVMPDKIIPFAHYEPNSFDIVINEIMADPTPAVMLPEYEYIELYNTTPLPINLKDFVLTIGTSNKKFGDVTIDPNGYLILCHENAVSLFSTYGKTYGFSSFSISNTGVNISLKNPLNSIISFAAFSSDWYKNSFKSDGGWSVEQIDPLNPCLGYDNWTASNDYRGGTPGAKNSVDAINPDKIIPELLRITLENDSTIRLWFSEPMDSSTVLNPSNYSINNGLSIFGMPIGISPEYQNVIISLNKPVEYGTVYTLTVTDTLTDCVGNMAEISTEVRFAKADSLEIGDIVINEVLFDPVVGVQDYVELINRSNKIIDLRFVVLATLNDSLQLAQQSYVAPNGFTMFPGEYIAFSKDAKAVINHYNTIAPKQVLNISKMPSYNNDKGIVVLALAAGTILDQFNYTAKMHDPILKSVDGVALERIDFNRPTADSTNWHSAASTVNYGTPGYKNSQYSQYKSENTVSVFPETFSPDNDGYNDVLNISWKFNQQGVICNMKIFDSNGQFVKHIFQNSSIGSEGTITWDGKNENGEKCPIGIYILFTDVFTSSGYTEKIKTVFVIAGKF